MEIEFKESLEEWCIRNNQLDLLKEWDYDANENLTPKNVNICYTTPVHWILPYDDPISGKHFDFKWEALISNRRKGHKCPYLSNQQIWPGFNDLATRNPELAKQWHPTKNGDLKPWQIGSRSGQIIWWYYPYDDPITGKHFDFEWQASVSNRSRRFFAVECPFLCGRLWSGFNDLATRNPELAKQWHPTKNNGLFPTDVSDKSNKVVWWYYPYDDPITGKHFDFEWQASVWSRSNGTNCPFLYNKVWPGFNDLATRNPELAKQWHPTKNNGLLPIDVSTGSNKVVWWYYPYDDPITGKHFDFEWQASVCSRSDSITCPFLYNKVWPGFNDLATRNHELAKQWHPTKNNGLLPTDVAPQSNKRVWWYYPYDDPITGKHSDLEWQAVICDRSNSTDYPLNKKECTDHLGNVYSSIRDMCGFYGITTSLYFRRVKLGWTLEAALTTPKGKCNPDVKHIPPQSVSVCDYLGNMYESTNEMCRHYGIMADTYRARINNGWTIKDALTIPIGSSNPNKKVIPANAIQTKDHLGNVYDSINEMCRHYGITVSSYSTRIKSGWTLRETLTIPLGSRRPNKTSIPSNALQVKDHLGNIYASISEMCRHYKITNSAYRARIKNNWSLTEIFTTPLGEDRPNVQKISPHAAQSKDHLGNVYKSLHEMCQHYDIHPATYSSRIECGWTVEEALTIPKGKHRPNIRIIPNQAIQVKDHLGNIYESTAEMCRHYGITNSSYSNRIKKGWTVEEALTTPKREHRPNVKYIHSMAVKSKDHLGNVYDSLKEMCHAYGITSSMYCDRIKRGWTVEEALTIPNGERNPNVKPNRAVKFKDHLDNVYGSLKEMCHAYDITSSLYYDRIKRGWTVEEALTLPKCMYIGEYRVAKCLT